MYQNTKQRLQAQAQQQAARVAAVTGMKPAADAAKRQAESTGDLFDPRTDPRTATVYNADGSTGPIDKATELQSRDNQLTNRAMNAYTTAGTNATGSRAAADKAATGRPTYAAPSPYVTPTYQAPDAYTAPDPYSYGGTRPGYESDADVAAHYQSYMGLSDPNGGYGDYQPAQVGDFSGAFNTWLTGAQSSFGKSLGDQLSKLTESAGARGRLQSGFYNKDTGTLSRQVAGDFSDKAQMAALDAANLSYQASRDNAGNSLSFARDRAGARQSASQNALAEALARSQYLDTSRQGDYESDRGFDYGVYGDAADRGRANYENDRNFGRNTFENDRDFGSQRYDDDRDFGYQSFQDQDSDWQNDRDFAETRYQNDVGQGNNDRDFYADWLSGQEDRNTEKTRYKSEQPSGWEKAAGYLSPVLSAVTSGIAGRRK